jgi:hypothetical protein
MSLYAQFEVSNWEFKTDDGSSYLLDYINKETVTYDASGHAKVTLSMQLVSDGLKDFLTHSCDKNLTLYRYRILRSENDERMNFNEFFKDIKLESYSEDALCGNVCEMNITAKTGEIENYR